MASQDSVKSAHHQRRPAIEKEPTIWLFFAFVDKIREMFASESRANSFLSLMVITSFELSFEEKLTIFKEITCVWMSLNGLLFCALLCSALCSLWLLGHCMCSDARWLKDYLISFALKSILEICKYVTNFRLKPHPLLSDLSYDVSAYFDWSSIRETLRDLSFRSVGWRNCM